MAAADVYIERLVELDETAEQDLLNQILEMGFDQGCFLHPEDTDLLPFDASQIERVLAVSGARTLVRANKADPFPDGRDTEPVPGDAPGFVVLTQRCDLISGVSVEPFVELARAVPLKASSDDARSARLNSARSIELQEVGDELWIADLRVKAWLPKDRLPRLPAVNVVPRELRQRLKLRLGQRFSRDALSVELVEALQRPLIKAINKNATTRGLAAMFTDWLVLPEENHLRLIAVLSPDYTQRDGDDAFDELAGAFTEDMEALLTENSGAVAMGDLDVLTWLAALKINLDEISWHPKRGIGQAGPTR